MKSQIILALSLLFLASSQPALRAQSWHQAQSVAPNYHAIRQQFLDHWKGKTPKKGEGYSVFKRWEWFWESRVMPDGSFPPSDFVETEWNNYLAARPEAENISAANWTSMGPSSSNSGYNGVGRVNCVTVDPTNSNTIWIGTPAGGLWKSTDGGASWATNTDNFTVLGVSAVVIDPTNTDTMYIGTGDAFGGDTRSRGVLKSTDGGATWNTTGLTFSGTSTIRIRYMAMHPAAPNVILVAASNGLYQTNNGGANWKKKSGDDFFDVKFSPDDPNIAYAASDDRIFKSTDGGETWTVTFTVPSSDRLAIAVTPADPAMLAVVSSSNETNSFGALNGLYVSTDTGSTFDLRSSSPNILGWDTDGFSESGQGWYDLCIAVSPEYADLIFVGAVNLWQSFDGGVSWSLTTHWNDGGAPPGIPVVHADKHALTWSGNTLLNGCDGGVYQTSDYGWTWTDLSSNLAISQMYRLGVSQSDNKVICGLQDNGTKLRSNAGNWTDNIGGDGMECFIHPTNSNIMYGEWQYGNISRSTDGGGFWEDIHQNVPGEPQGAWITPFVIDPNNSSTIYVGYDEVFKSTIGGGNWTSISSALPNLPANCIIVQPKSGGVLYVGMDVGVYRREPGATSWELFNTGLPNTPVMELEIRHSTGKIRAATYGRGLWQSDLAPLNPVLIINPVSLTFPAAGGVQTMTLTTSCDWNAANIPAWLTVNPSFGSAGTVTVTVTADTSNSVDSQSVVIAFSGCNGQVAQNLTVEQLGQTSGVGDLNKKFCNSVLCIPNPASESALFLIQTDQPQTVHLDILTADGRVVAALKNVAVGSGENAIPWQPRDLPAGHYWFRCFFEKEVLSGRVVVMR